MLPVGREMGPAPKQIFAPVQSAVAKTKQKTYTSGKQHVVCLRRVGNTGPYGKAWERFGQQGVGGIVIETKTQINICSSVAGRPHTEIIVACGIMGTKGQTKSFYAAAGQDRTDMIVVCDNVRQHRKTINGGSPVDFRLTRCARLFGGSLCSQLSVDPLCSSF